MSKQQSPLEQAKKLHSEGNRAEALEILKNIPQEDSKEYCDVLLEKASIERDLGLEEASKKSYEQSLSLANTLNSQILQLEALRSLAFWTHIFKEPELQKQYVTKILELLPNIDEHDTTNFKTLANTYALLGNIEFLHHNYLSAEEHYLTGMEFATKVGFEKRIITLTADLANVFIKQEKYKEALRELAHIEEGARAKYKKVVPQILLRKAIVHKSMGDTKKAIKIANEGLEIAENFVTNDVKEITDFLQGIE